jgi:hypothetical protein
MRKAAVSFHEVFLFLKYSHVLLACVHEEGSDDSPLMMPLLPSHR